MPHVLLSLLNKMLIPSIEFHLCCFNCLLSSVNAALIICFYTPCDMKWGPKSYYFSSLNFTTPVLYGSICGHLSSSKHAVCRLTDERSGVLSSQSKVSLTAKPNQLKVYSKHSSDGQKHGSKWALLWLCVWWMCKQLNTLMNRIDHCSF